MKKPISVQDYMKKYGVCRKTVDDLINAGALEMYPTRGNGKHYLLFDDNPEIISLKAEIEELKEMISVMCKHFGVI
jgi:hypothetical protein